MARHGTLSGGGRWAVVLAGGEGERLRPVIRQWLGCERPKQYCSFSGGGRTMLDHTLERARAVAAPGRVLTVIGPGHRRWLPLSLDAGRILEQPAGRDTGPGILLPAAHALREDPEATLLVFHSDHYIHPASRFRAAIEEAAAAAEARPDRLVLMGADPDEAETEYGWIEPDWSDAGSGGAMPVAAFREKPSREAAEELFESGCMWNTFIMAVKARTLWELARAAAPDVVAVFDALLPCLGGRGEDAALKAAYARLPPCNFSREVLEKVPRRVLVQPLTGVEWSDWGRPARIAETLARRGLPTPFALGAAAAAC
ncbi:MAG: NTP transferase domain-containing protein [Elusimicrobia bacterium]|nr:NTP transferase domain-containing protein [Elusimicrobiota bacterium]